METKYHVMHRDAKKTVAVFTEKHLAEHYAFCNHHYIMSWRGNRLTGVCDVKYAGGEPAGMSWQWIKHDGDDGQEIKDQIEHRERECLYQKMHIVAGW